MLVEKEFIEEVINRFDKQLKDNDLNFIYLNLGSISKAKKFSQLLINLGYTVEQILDKVRFPNSNSAYSHMFSGCDLPEDITITCCYTGASTFKNCKSLKTVRLNEVEEIEYGCFQGCFNLKNIYLPSTLIKIENLAFDGIDENPIFHIDMTEDEFKENVKIDSRYGFPTNSTFIFNPN